MRMFVTKLREPSFGEPKKCGMEPAESRGGEEDGRKIMKNSFLP